MIASRHSGESGRLEVAHRKKVWGRADAWPDAEGKIANWWMPDDVLFVDSIPLGATGKIDKKVIRQQIAGYTFPTKGQAQ
jgi:acyl-CoA synthetase (AMP-forming)/AMP-acid ligase II